MSLKRISRESGEGQRWWVKVELTPRARDCLLGGDSLYSLFRFGVGVLHNGPQLTFVLL